jgi:hypothetical protein
MQQSPSSETNSPWGSQEILRLLQNRKVHYHVHTSPSLVPILSQMRPIHAFLIYFVKTNSGTILPSASRSSEWYLPLKFSDQHFVCVSYLSNACYMITLSISILYRPYLSMNVNKNPSQLKTGQCCEEMETSSLFSRQVWFWVLATKVIRSISVLFESLKSGRVPIT